jgi:hypothetical protein
LWHGNVFQALQALDHIEMDLETIDDNTAARDKLVKLTKMVREFHGYIEGNRPLIPNDGERYRSGEIVSPAFVESTMALCAHRVINEVVSKRMVKKQQMRWTKQGAHRLLQVRTQTLNDDLQGTFRRWYPAMPHTEIPIQLAA